MRGGQYGGCDGLSFCALELGAVLPRLSLTGALRFCAGYGREKSILFEHQALFLQLSFGVVGMSVWGKCVLCARDWLWCTCTKCDCFVKSRVIRVMRWR